MFKRIFAPVLLAVMCLVGLAAFAQDLPPATTTDSVFQALASLIGSVKGASTLAAIVLIVQFLSAFVLSPLWDGLKLDPKYKFLAFAILSIVGTVIPLMIQGQTWYSALFSGGVLVLLMQYGHRIYELFFEQPAP